MNQTAVWNRLEKPAYSAHNEASAIVVKAFKSFQIFPVPDGESGGSCRVRQLEGSGRPRYIPPGEKPGPGFTF